MGAKRMADNSPPEIVISGAGPSGLAAALTIAKVGGKAIVYERLADGTRRLLTSIGTPETATIERTTYDEATPTASC
jgi:2-polyprenyl-6-methoxyphenol hydroxylase-like FAD-dependent oxidoreductase